MTGKITYLIVYKTSSVPKQWRCALAELFHQKVIQAAELIFVDAPAITVHLQSSFPKNPEYLFTEQSISILNWEWEFHMAYDIEEYFVLKQSLCFKLTIQLRFLEFHINSEVLMCSVFGRSKFKIIPELSIRG